MSARADPADFQAMPGLWQIKLMRVTHGRASFAQTLWRCFGESSDPWKRFAESPPLQADCLRSDEQRSSTGLSWNLHCGRGQSVSGQGRVDFDSPQHYTLHLSIDGRGEVLRGEGRRRAACTDPSD